MRKMKYVTSQLRLKKPRRSRSLRAKTFRDLHTRDRGMGSGGGWGGLGGASPPTADRNAGSDHLPALDTLVVNHVLI